MPLVRFQVRNEYGLGLPELYKKADREDPKAVLDGVAVAGLVGILRQLGDLAEFAAEVFHGLQEEVMSTSSRSHKLMVRVQHIEAALPSLEKDIFAQRSHLHFAYTSGSNWHARLRSDRNHFIYNDLPRFIMDSYEECRSPPHLHLLDKFDTGGPGSCLKRYSDPTFFKRVSAGSNKGEVEKVSRDKRARRIKKKRLGKRSGEVSREVSMSSFHGRTQCAPRNVNGLTSPSRIVSTYDTTLKSDLGDQSNFDSRFGSGYIDCVFHPNYSMKSEEQESRESSSQLKMQSNDAIHCGFLEERSRVEDDDVRNRLSQEQTGPSSSWVTWDEKTELVESTDQQFDYDETPEMPPTNHDVNAEEREPVNFRTVDQLDLQYDDKNKPTSVSGVNLIDDIESEPDNYMDALNTIESESETDLDCQTKREVEQCSNANNKAIENEMHGFAAESLDHHSSNFGSHIVACSSPNRSASMDNSRLVSSEPHVESYCSSNKEKSEVRPNSIPLEYLTHLVSDQMADISLNPGSLLDISSCGSADIHDGPNVESLVHHVSSPGSREPNSGASVSDQVIESLVHHVSSPGSREPNSGASMSDQVIESLVHHVPSPGSREPNSGASMGDQVINTPYESQIPPPEFSTANSNKFWTNGGLLGLQPSKPPDFSVLNASSQDSMPKSKDDAFDPSSQSNVHEGNRHGGKLDAFFQSSQIVEQGPSSNCSSLCHNDQEDGICDKKTSWKLSPAGLDENFEKSTDFRHTKSFDRSQGHDVDESSRVTNGIERPVCSEVQATKAGQEDASNLSRMFDLSNRLIVNGFRRKLSLSRDDNSGPANSFNTDVFEQKNRHQTVVQQTSSGMTKEQYGYKCPLMSPSYSPPLEHMKISFQPVNGFETSKLKLKFPDRNNCRENSGDMFPSFQLVPDPTVPLHDIDSDTDDNTFCRSSPYLSDDCLSHHSESDSEQWESGESPSSKDHELYDDALCRISSSGSVSTTLDIQRTDQGGIYYDYRLQNPFAENGGEHSQTGPLFDLPSFDNLPSFKQELDNDVDAKDHLELHFPEEPTPLPPPLPPLEWRAMKLNPDAAEVEQDAVSDAPNYACDLKLAVSTISQQPKPAPIKLDQIVEAAHTLKSQQPDWQKLNGHNEANQAANGKRVDEKEDFLHQIRTKSFSLRHTVTPKPPITPAAPADVKVTAILEKANAIRQAVGSDDGEDEDNWSDT